MEPEECHVQKTQGQKSSPQYMTGPKEKMAPQTRFYRYKGMSKVASSGSMGLRVLASRPLPKRSRITLMKSGSSVDRSSARGTMPNVAISISSSSQLHLSSHHSTLHSRHTYLKQCARTPAWSMPFHRGS